MGEKKSSFHGKTYYLMACSGFGSYWSWKQYWRTACWRPCRRKWNVRNFGGNSCTRPVDRHKCFPKIRRRDNTINILRAWGVHSEKGCLAESDLPALFWWRLFVSVSTRARRTGVLYKASTYKYIIHITGKIQYYYAFVHYKTGTAHRVYFTGHSFRFFPVFTSDAEIWPPKTII